MLPHMSMTTQGRLFQSYTLIPSSLSIQPASESRRTNALLVVDSDDSCSSPHCNHHQSHHLSPGSLHEHGVSSLSTAFHRPRRPPPPSQGSLLPPRPRHLPPTPPTNHPP